MLTSCSNCHRPLLARAISRSSAGGNERPLCDACARQLVVGAEGHAAEQEAPSIGQVAVVGGTAAPVVEQGPPPRVWVPPVLAKMREAPENFSESTDASLPRPKRQRILVPTPRRPRHDEDETDPAQRASARRSRHRRRWLLALVVSLVGVGAIYYVMVPRAHHEQSTSDPLLGTPSVTPMSPSVVVAPVVASPRPVELPAASPVKPVFDLDLEPVPSGGAGDRERREHREHDGAHLATRPVGPRSTHGAAPTPSPSPSPSPSSSPAAAPTHLSSTAAVPASVSAHAPAPSAPPARVATAVVAPAASPAPAATATTTEAGDHYGLARDYLRDKKVDLAISELKKAIAGNPRDARSYWLLGMAYNVAGAEKSAVDAFERFVQLDPGHKDAAKARAMIADYHKRHPR